MGYFSYLISLPLKINGLKTNCSGCGHNFLKNFVIIIHFNYLQFQGHDIHNVNNH